MRSPLSLEVPLQSRHLSALVRHRLAFDESVWVRRALIGLALSFVGLFLVLPLVTVFARALGEGPARYFHALTSREALAAIRLTLFTAAIVVPVNLVVGVAAAWLIAKFRFPGRSLLLTLVDLPFSVSPVIAGLAFVLLLGRSGLLGPWLQSIDVQVIFSTPGIVLATLFVTFPFVAREVLPLMQSQGNDQEEAALTLGASGFQTFFRVTLPRVKWALLSGVVLCNARAMGEFGAVSVVSGHIRGVTNTVPLHVEILYNEYDSTGAFAVASLLTLLAVVTLLVKKFVEWRTE
ncbi:MAG: sulfate ABC transporter permease subunit CysW [Archangium sp.]|nr:sulfate ABC transporter permease subunit CysW [Archangium sp.]MDP3151559.1 sulfate ABC transporter permease subunit CysW [Archangium sp.]MDP3572146.1 sulfate ABC transporter permease subunit CysW [Archangium sp.]